ncbi:MAG: hypothetical protein Q8K55_06145, partial [Gemmatimonadaceae bacterium]|nr:hypothetical protein [Gemmatimonadaceae bacterium]
MKIAASAEQNKGAAILVSSSVPFATRPMPFLTTRNATLHYTVTGQGPVALLIQGVGAVGDVWRPQVEALSGEFTC